MIWLRHDLTASRHDLRRAHDFSLRSMNNAEGKSCDDAAIHCRDINTTFSIWVEATEMMSLVPYMTEEISRKHIIICTKGFPRKTI